MLLHVLLYACSSSPTAEISDPAKEAILSSYQTTATAAEDLENQARGLAEEVRELKSQKWARSEAEQLLQNLQRSTDALEARVNEIEASLGNSSASLHTSHNSR